MPPAQPFLPGVTVVGNVAVDRVDRGAPSAGGCPAFAAAAFTAGVAARIVTQCAAGDAAVFASALDRMAVPVTVLDAETTSAFDLVYHGEDRTMSVTALGEPWTVERLAGVPLDTTWVHAAPLLRSDFPVATIAALAQGGHAVSFDGQGLVRDARLGPLVTDSAYDPKILPYLTVLKLADDEAAVVAGGAEFTEADAARLGVPEILVTFGSAGVDVYLGGVRTHVSSNRRIWRVHTTGSGDMFSVAYAAARAAGTDPLVAAHNACELVADVLERRRGA